MRMRNGLRLWKVYPLFLSFFETVLFPTQLTNSKIKKGDHTVYRDLGLDAQNYPKVPTTWTDQK